jgi:ABC-type transport system involved in cytochrome c biogenesis ATPase subunit
LLKFYSRWNRQSKEARETLFNSVEIKPILDKPFSLLEEENPHAVMMALLTMSRGSLYLLDRLATEIPIKEMVEFKDKLETLAGEGAMVFYLTTPWELEFKNLKKGIYFADGSAWIYRLKSEKSKLEIEEEIKNIEQ